MAWLLAVAMEAEARLLLPRLSPANAVGGRACYQGSLAGRQVYLVLTGLGQVNAAQAVTAALERLPGMEAVLNLGCAGAYAGSGLAVGQAALATEVISAELGVASARGWRPLEALGIPLLHDGRGRPLYNRLPVDQALSDLLARANPGLARGAFVCVAQVSGDPATAQALAARWGGMLEDMESAAVAQVAALYGLPFAALRGVSNQAGARELDVAAGAGVAQEALLRLEA